MNTPIVNDAQFPQKNGADEQRYLETGGTGDDATWVRGATGGTITDSLLSWLTVLNEEDVLSQEHLEGAWH